MAKRKNGEGTWGEKTINGVKYKYFRIKCALVNESSAVDFVYMRFINPTDAPVDGNQG